MADKQYEIGYLNGQLDSAENELEILREIKDLSNEDWHESNILMVRIKDTEKFLRKNGRIK